MRLIDADALMKRFEEMQSTCDSVMEVLFFDGVMAMLENTPTIKAEPVRRGRWEYYRNASAAGTDVWTCSECGTGYSWVEEFRRCPNCGVKMGSEG